MGRRRSHTSVTDAKLPRTSPLSCSSLRRILIVLPLRQHGPDRSRHLVCQCNGHKHPRLPGQHPGQPRSLRDRISPEPVQTRHRSPDQQPPDVGLSGLRYAPNGLMARGAPRFDIFSEIFRSPTTRVANDGRTHRVTFSRTCVEPKTWSAADGPLLQFAERLGIDLPSGCRVGQCESCAVRVVSGKVVHLHGTEPDDPDTCPTCQAVPLSDLVLDA